MYKAFLALGEKQAYLGYDNYDYTTMNCCGPLPELKMAHKYAFQDNAYGGPDFATWKPFIIHSPDIINRFEGALQLLNGALDDVRAASGSVAGGDQEEFEYLVNRTEFYRDYMQSIITIRKAYMWFDDAFRDRRHVPEERFRSELEESLAGFDLALQQVKAATTKFAEIIDLPSDLGVLYQPNRAVLGFDLVHETMQISSTTTPANPTRATGRVRGFTLTNFIFFQQVIPRRFHRRRASPTACETLCAHNPMERFRRVE